MFITSPTNQLNMRRQVSDGPEPKEAPQHQQHAPAVSVVLRMIGKRIYFANLESVSTILP